MRCANYKGQNKQCCPQPLEYLGQKAQMEPLRLRIGVHRHYGEAVCLPRLTRVAVCHQLRWIKPQVGCSRADKRACLGCLGSGWAPLEACMEIVGCSSAQSQRIFMFDCKVAEPLKQVIAEWNLVSSTQSAETVCTATNDITFGQRLSCFQE